MDKNKKFINNYGVFASIVACLMGVSIFSHSRLLVEKVGTIGWIVSLVAGILAFFIAYLIYYVIKVNDFATLDVILENSLGKILGKLLGILFAINALYTLSAGLREFVEVIKMYLLEKTPTELIIVIFILSGIYLIRGELKSVVGFNGIAVWLMFIPIIAMLFALEEGDIRNILPLMPNGEMDIIGGVNTALFAFVGFEILYFLLPYTKEKSKIPKALKNSFIIITVVYSLSVILTLVLFSQEESKILMWPAITLVRSIDIPGLFLERWEGIVLTFWMIFFYTTFINLYFFSTDLLKNVFNLKDVKLTTIFTSAIIYILAMYPENIADVTYQEEVIIPMLSGVFIVILPIILLLLSLLKKRGGNE